MNTCIQPVYSTATSSSNSSANIVAFSPASASFLLASLTAFDWATKMTLLIVPGTFYKDKWLEGGVMHCPRFFLLVIQTALWSFEGGVEGGVACQGRVSPLFLCGYGAMRCVAMGPCVGAHLLGGIVFAVAHHHRQCAGLDRATCHLIRNGWLLCVAGHPTAWHLRPFAIVL
jgi:hypothetical protein